jgi:4-amino-4-deoxy-L-arabinose transferase-like glycosyltransferase
MSVKTASSFAPAAQTRPMRLPELLWTIIGLLALLGIALWLRWQYVRDISLSVDEFTTLWAARRVLETGAPIMPSGVLYTRGLLTTYVTAAFELIGGDNVIVGRLPSLVFGLATVVALFAVARREWNARVAWLATLGLVLLPEAVIWSGRARFYAQLLLFALLTLWAAYAAITPRSASTARVAQVRPPLLFALLFVLALIAQEQTILLYPSIVLCMWLWRGWRYLWQPAVLAANGICVIAMGLRFWVEQVGQPGYFASVQSYKPYINLFADAPELWASYSPLFFEPARLPWTLAALVAILVALRSLWQAQGRLDDLPRGEQATLFFGLNFLSVLLILLLIVGGSWNDPRYIFMLQPCWLLLGAAGAVWLVERITPVAPVRWALTGGLALAIFFLYWPLATGATREDNEGYDAALAYVAAERQPDDVVMSPQPPACAYVLGEPCDYYARERGFEPYAIERGGVLIDRWSGAQVLSTAEEMAQVVQRAPRVWFVVDKERLGRRYRTDYLTVVVQQFRRVFEERGVVVLLAEGWRDVPPATVERVFDPPLALGGLALAAWSRNEAQPGEQLYMTFFWEKVGDIDQQINTSLQVVAADGRRITQKDGPPAGGWTTTYDFERTQLPDAKKLTLPADLAPGRYRLDVVAYAVATGELLADPIGLNWFWVGQPPAAPQVPVEVAWQNGITLLGHDELPSALTPGAALPLRLVWTTTQPVANNFTIFLHLVGPDGAIIGQMDQPPEGGFYPTSGWREGEPVADRYSLLLPSELPHGQYQLLVGLYRTDTLERARLADGVDVLPLAEWQVD